MPDQTTSFFPSPCVRPASLLALLALMLTFLVAGCGGDGSSDQPSPDEEQATAFPTGKADSPWSECQLDAVVMLANSPDSTVDALKDVGVHSRAAKNIVAARNGEDGLAGTEDDALFTDAEDIDDVYYVGPVAMSQLVEAVTPYCEGIEPGAEVIMSPQEYGDSHLARAAELIDQAERSVDVAMYSFRDNGIRDALANAVDRGVAVRVVFEGANDDRKDPEGSMSATLESLGMDVRYVNKIMHHKMMIIDGPQTSPYEALGSTIFTGSGNWSYSAGTRYDENTTIITGNAEMALRFQKQFNHLWRNSRDFEYTEQYDLVETTPIEDWMMVDDEDLDMRFTSDNFDVYTSNRYGRTFSVIRGSNVVSDAIVEHIENAQESIYIASGHLRSRPIAEALIAKHQQNPEMDIRVYLDGQEYISEWYHNQQVMELEDCLTEAGDSEAQQQDCLDSGFYFSYQAVLAGVDVRFKHYAYRWHYTYADQLHHKYLIIDNETVISGSYNFSDNAEHNTIENTVIYERSGFPGVVDAFAENFESIWVTGEDEGYYDTLLDEVLNGTDDVPIVYDSMALTWDQVDALKGAISEACVDINSDAFRRHPERKYYCHRE